MCSNVGGYVRVCVRRFVHHSAVHKYLSKYADKHSLRPLISFGRKVTSLQVPMSFPSHTPARNTNKPKHYTHGHTH